MTAESSTTKTRIFFFIVRFPDSEQFHGSRFDLRTGRREVPLALEHRAIDSRCKALHAHLTGRRAVVELAGEGVAEILGADGETFLTQGVAHELHVMRAHVERYVEYLAAAEHLELE